MRLKKELKTWTNPGKQILNRGFFVNKFSALMLAVLTLVSLTFTQFASATASSITVAKSSRQYENGKRIRVVKVTIVASSVDGSVTDTVITGLHGYLMKAITNPGATAPTANYDIQMFGADDVTADALNQTLMNRHTTNTEVVWPVGALGAAPLYFVPDSYTLNVTNNSVNSAGIVIWLYFTDSL